MAFNQLNDHFTNGFGCPLHGRFRTLQVRRYSRREWLPPTHDKIVITLRSVDRKLFSQRVIAL
ncbi:MAG: hypothetical protein F6J98_39965 [Moorea sp. SIO4G2]|uniref:hypothetical protein n=1 Tax=Moorena TaxID=1155738 RepID=UPI0013FA3562|nr:MULTISPECIES: hypothetical protein [Moorena]NEO16980.1 hypothetical protein [Moorena sp. SIO3E8]NEO51074.1 hypothetical protein [Moorena sp. SIO4A3]NEO66231.1 hypothetical protein [Moorena sp. SIO4G2]NEQ62230.1 hypothetical protein [Moorena sp. SIO4A1]